MHAQTLRVERRFFLDTLNTVLDECNSEVYLLLGGDFNCVGNNMDGNHVETHFYD